MLLRTLASDDEEFALINKKGFYPYELITSQDKLFMPITELRKKHFDSKLTLSTISDSDFELSKHSVSLISRNIMIHV